jgi:polyhydroxyalkanoate synthesis regulator phasin
MAGGAAQAAQGAMNGAAASNGAGAGHEWFARFAPQFGGGATADLARRYFGFYDQYLGATRSLWEVLNKAMVNPDPNARARAVIDGLQALHQPFTQLWSQSAANFGLPGASLPGGADMFSSLSKAWGGAGGGAEMPALGLTRERQESLQRIQALSAQYLQQQAQLAQLWGGVIGDALQKLGERLGAKFTAGETISSSKALYDLWIESAEEVYAKVAHSPAYAKAQADLGNTLAKLRTEQRIAIEAMTSQYDLPTREELNTVHKRIKDLKTELRRLTERLDEPTRAANRKPKKG